MDLKSEVSARRRDGVSHGPVCLTASTTGHDGTAGAEMSLRRRRRLPSQARVDGPTGLPRSLAHARASAIAFRRTRSKSDSASVAVLAASPWRVTTIFMLGTT